jgi:hypothetical protein
MIRVNLLGKKKAASSFGPEELLGKVGVKYDDVLAYRMPVLRLLVTAGGLYLGNYLPTYFHDQKLHVLDQEFAALTARSSAIQMQLVATKEVTKKMESLQNEERELHRKLDAIAALQRDQKTAFQALDNVVSMLSQKEVSAVWIDSLVLERRGTERLVSLVGKCWTYAPIFKFLSEITESTQYSNVVFYKTEATGTPLGVQGVPEKDQKVKSFAVDFNVKSLGE